MVEITLVKLSESIPFYSDFLRFLSARRRLQISEYQNDIDKKRSLLSELLIRKAALEKLGVASHQIKLSYNPYGKPYIDNVRYFKFNISHSGSYVVIAVSRKIVGIDIEKIQDVDLTIARRCFTAKEYNYIQSQKTKDDQRKAFFMIWTLKESYIKALGKGLKLPMNSFEFDFDDKITLSKQKGKMNFNFCTTELGDYSLALCSVEPPSMGSTCVINEEEIYQYYRKQLFGNCSI